MDPASSVRFAFTLLASEKFAALKESNDLEGVDWAAVVGVRQELCDIMQAKAGDGKKPAKGATPVAEPADVSAYSEADLTDAVISAASVELLRKCLAIRLLFDTSCARRGFVLDVWRNADAADPLQHVVADRDSVTNSLFAIFEEGKAPSLIMELVVELQVTLMCRIKRSSSNGVNDSCVLC